MIYVQRKLFQGSDGKTETKGVSWYIQKEKPISGNDTDITLMYR